MQFGTPVMDTIQPLPWPAMQSLFTSAFPDGNKNYWKSTLQRESDDAKAAIVEHGDGMSRRSLLLLSNFTVARRGGLQTTLPPTLIVTFAGTFCFWPNAPMGTRLQYSGSGLGAARDAHSVFRKRALPSALNVKSEEVIHTAFGANRARLRAIKQKYDPTNFFRVNYNIKPAARIIAA